MSSGYEKVRDASERPIVLGWGLRSKVIVVRRRGTREKLACKITEYEEPARGVSAAITREDIEREYRILSSLCHFSIVEYIDIEWPARSWKAKIYMELCNGNTLQHFIDDCQRKNTHSSSAFVFKAGIELSSALAYCHEHNVLHRDIKPQNIFMITDHDLPLFFKLGDFGFSVELDSPRHPSNFLGTVPYTAPEITNRNHGHREWTAKSDIFALGCTLYHLCMHQPPFEYHMKSEQEVFTPLWADFLFSVRLPIVQCIQYQSITRPTAAELQNLLTKLNPQYNVFHEDYAVCILPEHEWYSSSSSSEPTSELERGTSTKDELERLQGELQKYEENIRLTTSIAGGASGKANKDGAISKEMLDQYYETAVQGMNEGRKLRATQRFWNPIANMLENNSLEDMGVASEEANKDGVIFKEMVDQFRELAQADGSARIFESYCKNVQNNSLEDMGG